MSLENITLEVKALANNQDAVSINQACQIINDIFNYLVPYRKSVFTKDELINDFKRRKIDICCYANIDAENVGQSYGYSWLLIKKSIHSIDDIMFNSPLEVYINIPENKLKEMDIHSYPHIGKTKFCLFDSDKYLTICTKEKSLSGVVSKEFSYRGYIRLVYRDYPDNKFIINYNFIELLGFPHYQGIYFSGKIDKEVEFSCEYIHSEVIPLYYTESNPFVYIEPPEDYICVPVKSIINYLEDFLRENKKVINIPQQDFSDKSLSGTEKLVRELRNKKDIENSNSPKKIGEFIDCLLFSIDKGYLNGDVGDILTYSKLHSYLSDIKRKNKFAEEIEIISKNSMKKYLEYLNLETKIRKTDKN